MSKLEIFHRRKPVIGVIHLLPLPGSPLYHGNLEKVIRRALEDAVNLCKGGVDAILIENLGDMPYYPNKVPDITVAAMTKVALKISENVNLPLGINVLRNDCLAALSIAYVVDASFIRVNVLTEVVVTDQGIIEGKAHELMRLRHFLRADIKVLADVHVKHGYPLMKRTIEESAIDTVSRGLADGIIITGKATGIAPKLDEVRKVKNKLLEEDIKAPVLIGSGITADNVTTFLSICDGVIVGTYFKKGGDVWSPIDPLKVRRLIEKANNVR